MPRFYILIRNSGVVALSEVRAQCGNSARWDLCGGLLERAVPTATKKRGISHYTPIWPVLDAWVVGTRLGL